MKTVEQCPSDFPFGKSRDTCSLGKETATQCKSPLKYYENLTNDVLQTISQGTFFIYKTTSKYYGTKFRKGIKLGGDFMVPVGLLCETIEGAARQY